MMLSDQNIPDNQAGILIKINAAAPVILEIKIKESSPATTAAFWTLAATAPIASALSGQAQAPDHGVTDYAAPGALFVEMNDNAWKKMRWDGARQ